MNTVPVTSSEKLAIKKRNAAVNEFVSIYGATVAKALSESTDPGCKNALSVLNQVRSI